jgi:hypothetical protein
MRNLLIAAIVLGVAGCEMPTIPDSVRETPFLVTDTVFQLDTVAVTREVRVVLPYRWVNTSGRTLYTPQCNGVSPLLERKAGDDWVRAWHPIEACAQEPAFRLQPGDSLVGSVRVDGAVPENGLPRFDTPQSDTPPYRLHLLLFTEVDHGQPASAALPSGPQSVSTQFRILP